MDQPVDRKLDLVRVCPKCMSPMIDVSSVGSPIIQVGTDVVSDAGCRACGWKGKAGELANIPFENPFVDGTKTVEAFGRDVLMTIVRECAEPLGKLLIRWGFVNGKKIDKKQFSRYLSNVAKASAMSIIKTRDAEGKKQS